MRIFLICPVRRVSDGDSMLISAYVTQREMEGNAVHWPRLDTPQGGDGVAICEANRAAMERADEVHVWWSSGSEGSLFDLGMAFAMRKRIVLANRVDATPGKSFANVLLALAGGTR